MTGLPNIRDLILHDRDIDLDDVGGGADSESLGLGKYIAVGYNGLPTLVDPEADDWADVVANNYGWWQITPNGTPGEWDIYVGRGDGTSPLAAVSVGATYATVNLSDSGSDGLVNAFVNATTAQIAVTPVAGQTDPVVVLGTVMSVAPNGAVGGGTHNEGDTLTFTGGKWVSGAA